ncbi:MAG: Fic family protein [Patescibacteria group bacterium]|nr:Fic family protein [Patescibacteria group bacterium]
MTKLTKRQIEILDFIKKSSGASNQEIKNYLKNISRVTVIRDLNFLLENNLIKQKGEGRGVYYKEKVEQDFLRYIDVDKYFQSDERQIKFERFNFDIIKDLKDIFSSKELVNLQNLNRQYQERIKKLPDSIVKKEFERLTIELSWKSSKIEGNTYSLIDTEILIKEHQEAIGHKKEEAIMILNHKKAIDYISDKKSDFKKLTLGKIENVHSLIVDGLNIGSGLRKNPVRITGTQYLPMDNQHQIREAMEKVIQEVNKLPDYFSKAVFIMTIISYIQPFADGNKRTSRLLGNALLMSDNICPLSFRSINEVDYKKSVILFYEQNNLRMFKELFIEQFKFVVENYFLT